MFFFNKITGKLNLWKICLGYVLKRNFTPKFKKRASQINGSEINNFRVKKAKFADLSRVLLFAILFLLFSIDKTAVISKSPCFIYHNSFLFFTRFFWLFTLFYFLWFTALFYLLLSCVVCCFFLVCVLFIMFFMCISFRGGSQDRIVTSPPP